MKQLFLYSLLVFFFTTVQAQFAPAHANQLNHVDIRDLVQYQNEQYPFAKIVLLDLRRNSPRYYPFGVEFRGAGVKKRLYTRENAVYGVEIEGRVRYDRERFWVNLISFYHATMGGFRFRRHRVLVDQVRNQVLRIETEQDFSLQDTNFRVEIGLAQRKVILIDDEKDITKVYPIAVGAFDFGITKQAHGRTRLVTPIFTAPNIQPAFIQSERCDPNYYECKPFIRIMNGARGWTDIGFHIQQNPQLERGFVSHGCMRMREKDLYEMNAIFKYNSQKTSSVNMKMFLRSTIDHPYPMHNNWFHSVENFGTELEPQTGKDRFDLTALEKVQSLPPVHQLVEYQPSDEDRSEYEGRYRDGDDDSLIDGIGGGIKKGFKGIKNGVKGLFDKLF